MGRISSKCSAGSLALLACAALLATEPGGVTRISYAWLDPAPAPGSEGRVRVTVDAVVPLDDVVVRLDVPPGLVARFARNIDPSGKGSLEIGSLAVGRIITLELIVDVPTRGGGLASFRIAGRDPHGLPFDEGFGLPIGSLGPTPLLRHGALEFRAEPAPARSRAEDG